MVESEADDDAADADAVRDELEALAAVWPDNFRVVADRESEERGTRIEIDIPGPDEASPVTLTLSATIPKRGYPSRVPPSDVEVSASHLSAEDADAVAASLVSSSSPFFVPGSVVLFDWIEELRAREELYVVDKEEGEGDQKEEEAENEEEDGDGDEEEGDVDDVDVEQRRELALPLPSSSSTITTTTSSYLTVASEHTASYEVKKSTFKATCFPIASSEGAERGLEERSDASASHNCYAFVTPDGGDARCSDDGEPGGTAGRPILSAIFAEGGSEGGRGGEGEERVSTLPLRGVAVVVSRWRNGPLLGASGLVRAYGHAARLALRESKKIVVEASSRVLVQKVPLACLGGVFGALGKAGATETEEEENEGEESGDEEEKDQTVTLSATLPAKNVEDLISAVASATSGKARVAVL